MPNDFRGFPDDTFAFLWDIQENNSRSWFEANRTRYEEAWKTPALDLISSLQAPMAELAPALKAEARLNGSLRRINRDVRFSKDKSPYNARIHLVFWSGSHPNRSPGFHLVIHPDGIGYGAGVFGLDGSALAAYRQRILKPDQRRALMAAVEQANSAGCEFDEPDLKRLPKGFEADADWEHLLRRKSFVTRTHNPVPTPDWVFSDQCADKIMDTVAALMPLISWLAEE